MEPAWDADARAVTSPWFGSVAIVRRGVGYEREYLDWCRWLLETLNGHEAAHGRAAAERDGAPPHG